MRENGCEKTTRKIQDSHHHYFFYKLYAGQKLWLILLQAQHVDDGCNEFGVGWPGGHRLNGAAQALMQVLHVSPVPGDLNGLSHGAFHAAGGRVVTFRNFRVQNLCHGVHGIRVFQNKLNGVAEIMVAFDMEGDAKLVQQAGDA